MLVSIIVNNFNYGRFVGRAIESALNQTHRQIEVIVVDDGSTDNSREVIQSFGDQIKVVLKENGGQGSAFNVGFQISHGDLILFLDSDDVLYPQAVQRVVNAWRPNFSKVQYVLDVIDENDAAKGTVYPEKTLAEGDLLPLLLKTGSYPTAPTSGNVFSRQFLQDMMPIPEKVWVSHADCYLIHTAPFFGRVGAIHDSLGQYRVHSSTLSLSSVLVGGRLAMQRVRFHILRDTLQQELIQAHAEKRGMTMAPEHLLNGYCHYKFRFVSLKVEPAKHQFSHDRLPSVMTTLLRKLWQSSELAYPTRVAFTAWVLLVYALPKSSINRLILQGISPVTRSPLLAKLKLMQRSQQPAGRPA